MTKTPQSTSLLGEQIIKRLRQLGMSQRELGRRTGVSRQTVQNVIHRPHWGFSEETFAALDAGLKWEPGTARAFHEGIRDARERGIPSIEERINAYLTTILRRLGEMDIDQLEREVHMLEEESGGISSSHASRRLIEKQIDRLITSLTNNRIGHNRSDAG